MVVLICVGLRVVRPNPLGQLWCSAAWVELDLVPVGVLEKFGVREAKLLRAGVADEAEAEVDTNGLRDVFPAANLQARGD